MIFAYMRVSTNKQEIDRQKKTILDYATKNSFSYDGIVYEKVSGTIKTDNREEYKELKEKLRENDILIISDLDRLGRDADNTISELKELKAKGIKVVALDIPLMNEWNKVSDNSMYNMITDILITLKAHIAQQEREKTVLRINQGIAAAREKGTKLGRPKVELPENFIKEYKKFKDNKYGDMTAVSFAKMMKIGRATLYKYIKIYEKEGN